MQRLLLRGGRVVLHTVVGGALSVAGLVMLLTPGPGIVTLVLGLAVLAREYDWADRCKRAVLQRIRDASTSAHARLAAHRGRRATLTELPTGDGDDRSERVRPAS